MNCIEITPNETKTRNYYLNNPNRISFYEHKPNPNRVLTPEEISEIQYHMFLRNKYWIKDKLHLQIKRRNFLNLISSRYWISPVLVNEMYFHKGSVFKTPLETYNFFDVHFNTRTISPGELQLDIDTEDKDLGKQAIIETSQNLISDNKHFCIFYSEGQRSPQIRIYFVPELESQEKLRARVIRKLFWKHYVPKHYWKFMDETMFSEGKTCQLEFSTHWKYGTTFDLIFEFVPDTETFPKKKEEQTKLMEVKNGS